MKYLDYPLPSLLILMLLISALAPANARFASRDPQVLPGKFDPPTREEVIGEVARQTGLANDTVSVIAK